jgi:starch-binding outer membrane protein, SusD/RagB family
MKNKIYIIFMVMGMLLISNACTDLKENILDESFATDLSEKQIADGSIAPVYALLPTMFQHTQYFALQEISTDEAILPYRGGTDWFDNGIYLALHRHTYSSVTANVVNTWNNITTSLSRAVTAIDALKNSNDSNAGVYLAEARGMRAYYNMLLLDLFGLTFVKESPGERSTILRGDEAVNYIKNELLAAEPALSTTVGPGRMTKAAAWGLLARLHLNAAAYRDIYGTTFNFTTEDMDKVIEYCDKIITSGQYQLSNDYFKIFDADNHTNQELIFAVDQRAELNGHNRLAYFSLSGDQFPLPAFPAANGTDGPAITPDYYQTWEDAYSPQDPSVDPRFYKENLAQVEQCVADANFKMNRGILRGQQYGLSKVSNAFVRCEDGKLKVDKIYNASRNNPSLPVEFTKQIDFTTEGSGYSTGYRVLKYEFSPKSASGRNFGDVDIPILRLADIYLMRAEAKLRKNNDVAGALADVNTVRASRNITTPPPALASISLDLLYRERGFELYWEMVRRTDMIRFGKYEDTWTEKTNTDKNKRIFPIPQTAIDGASNIPNYLKQNQGY